MERRLLRVAALLCALFQMYKYLVSVPAMPSVSYGQAVLVTSRLLPLGIVLMFLAYSVTRVRGRTWKGMCAFLGLAEVGLFVLYFLPSAGHLDLILAMRVGGFMSAALGAGLLLLDTMQGRPASEEQEGGGAKLVVGGLAVGLVLLAIVATFLIWGR